MLIIAEAHNLYVGDDVPNASKHHNLMSSKLPTLEEKEQDLSGGGAIGDIAVGGLGLNKLEFTFKLYGHDPQVSGKFGIANTPFTVYGALRDKGTAREIGVKSILWGRLGKIEQDEQKRGDLLGHDYAVREILRYVCYFDDAEEYWYDWQASDWRIKGVSQNSTRRRLLGIPGA